ncbi:MAG: hypothetical protein JWQ14_352 [Adhaeribacter sp.]|nr:hypothetical protein [Adhaeribacter sp.]
MTLLETSDLSEAQKKDILSLWNQEYPVKLNFIRFADFEDYLHNLKRQKHYLMRNEAGEMQGWGFVFERDAEKWFALILAGKRQGVGYGTQLLTKLKEQEKKLSGWVIDHNRDTKLCGEYYKSPLGFYLKNGFISYPEIRLETETISAVKIEWTLK